MIENSLFFAETDIYDVIRMNGGKWEDKKERPLMCCVASKENEGLYYAIPLGCWDHRSSEAKKRITHYLDRPKNDIQSCFYHIGKTDRASIFFISDVIPITDKYLKRDYIGLRTKKPYVIKNNMLINELNYKLERILKWEEGRPNYFRQHITDVRNYLLNELESK